MACMLHAISPNDNDEAFDKMFEKYSPSNAAAFHAEEAKVCMDAPAENAAPELSGLVVQEDFGAYEPIAITGIALRLPGGIRNTDSFWDLLVEGKNGQCRVPKSRYNVDAFYKPGKAGHVGTEYGYFLNDLDLSKIDTSFWSMTRAEAEVVDPQQRLLLEVVHECLENAGEKSWRDSQKRVGCWVGTFGEDWLKMNDRDVQNRRNYRLTGYGDYAQANRISYEFGFNGPSVTVKTACSSSLTGLHLACESLQKGTCTSAIVAGSSIILTPQLTIEMTEQGLLSPTGSCKTFDASADGYARGEAVSAIYVKKLNDAIRDQDAIRAIIRGSCINSDGRSAGLMSPNPKAHEDLIRLSHWIAGIHDYSKTAMIECHGTGTQAGDSAETKAIANVFDKCGGIFIGSVKPNLGHSEGASGLSSVIKMVLALEHKIIPPNINFQTPNPNIPWKANLKVPVVASPWPQDRLERVGINNFGVGGSNAHVLLESAAMHGTAQLAVKENLQNRKQLLVFSAKHSDSLRRSIENYALYLSLHPDALTDLSYTLRSRRQDMAFRAFCVASEEDDLSASRLAKVSDPAPQLIFAFTGQGAQWARMGKELFFEELAFSQSMTRLDELLRSLPQPPQWSLQEEILKPEAKSRLSEAELSQPCCTAVQVALIDLLRSWGVWPQGVVGHSSGEIAAAYACGSLTAKEAILVAYYRGLATVDLRKTHSGMTAVGLGYDAISPYLKPGVVIACVNSPQSTTLSGDKEVLFNIEAEIKRNEPDVLVRPLKVEHAYHSHYMTTIATKYQNMLGQQINAKRPNISFYSSVFGGLLKDDEVLSTSYWIQNLVSPVYYSSAVRSILTTTRQTIFVEIGPHSALSGPTHQILRSESREAPYIPTLIRNKNAMTCVLNTVGELWTRNCTVDLASLGTGQLLTDVPTYPWHYDGSYWHESRLSREWRQREFAHHDLLGAIMPESTTLDPAWKNILSLDHVPWLIDHEVAGNVLLPAAGFIAMAGEAIRQITGTSDYTVRSVSFSTALILRPESEIEIITHLRKVRLTMTSYSVWYEFSIVSLGSSSWVRHCTGEIRAGPNQQTSAPDIQPLNREVPPKKWYRVMKECGLNYGPSFQGLSEITADPLIREATGKVCDQQSTHEGPYQIHPTTLDSALHLFGVAANHGVTRRFKQLYVPIELEELYVKSCRNPITLRADSPLISQEISGNLVGTSNGEVVIEIQGLRMSALGDSKDDLIPNLDSTVELEWKSDLNYIDATCLMRCIKDTPELDNLAEKLALACIIQSSTQVVDLQPSQPHFEDFRRWLQQQTKKAENGKHPHIWDSASIVALESLQRGQLIEELFQKLRNTEAAPVAISIYQVFNNINSIFEGQAEALEILHTDNALTHLYNFMQRFEYSEFLELLGHEKPNMRVLEIGAGTGGTTNIILPHLKSDYGERLYSSFTYTDISPAYFVAAKQRFKDFSGMHYAVLDITKDPLSQGFEAESFDLIIACNVLHATPTIQDTLKNVRRLLRPCGRLWLQELDPTVRMFNYVAGILPGWWTGAKDGRLDEPYISAERWDTELKKAGFNGTDSVVHDGVFLNNIIARPALAPTGKRVTALCHNIKTTPVQMLLQLLDEQDYEVDFCSLDDKPRTGQPILVMLDIEEPFLYSASESDFSRFQRFVYSIQDASILWLTGTSQIRCTNPKYSLILGMIRTIRNEFQLDFATFELQHFDLQGMGAVLQVLHGFQHRGRDSKTDPITEYAYADGRIQTGRFHWMSVSKSLRQARLKEVAKRVVVGRPGFLQTLAWQQFDPPELQDDMVQIEVKSAGLNFRDVLMSLGIINMASQGLGYEVSGIVRKVGSKVNNFSLGDKVVCTSQGVFSTTVQSPDLLCAKMADGLTFSDAATLPMVYSTALYGLLDIAHLAQNQTVLIHSACGGVGIAAIQVARMIGAEIFCTVGSEEKTEYLVKNFDIPCHRIFNSRNSDFLTEIRRQTSNQGVDVALNSLSGELLHTTWKCVAPFGTMVEIGKRDLIGRGKLSMDLFEGNRTYVGVDMAHIFKHRPQIIKSLLERTMRYFQQGHIKPIRPIKIFDAARIEDSMRYMQQGTHIGKCVLNFPNRLSDLPALSQPRSFKLRSDRTYFFVGGLGGLGRSVASWLVEHGARYLVLFSRSSRKVSPSDSLLRDLKQQGCSVQLHSGDVSCAQDVEAAISSAEKPLAGILHAPLVLEDAAFDKMTFQQWQKVIQPKVRGVWNLHHACLQLEYQLDFFLVFSSLSGVYGQWGQANYASSNTFLDAFVQYRHSLGLPACALQIGPMDDVGYVSQNAVLLETMRQTSMSLLREQDLLDSIQLMITDRARPLPQRPARSVDTKSFINHCTIGIGMRPAQPLTVPTNRTIWKKDPRMSVYRNIEAEEDSVTENPAHDQELRTLLNDARNDVGLLDLPESASLLARQIGATSRGFMMISTDDLDLQAPLASLGMDSLVSVELRNWLRRTVGVDFAVLEIVNAKSLQYMGEETAVRLKHKFQSRDR